jgi:hypothetical protein
LKQCAKLFVAKSLVKAVMASASVTLGMEFLVSEKRRMKSRRESPEA